MAASNLITGNIRATWRMVGYDRLPRLGLQEIKLRSVVPRHVCAVVPMIDEPRVTASEIYALEYHGRVRLGPVVVLQVDPDPRASGRGCPR